LRLNATAATGENRHLRTSHIQPVGFARTSAWASVRKATKLLNLIRYENELRKADKYFADLESVKFDPELVNLSLRAGGAQLRSFPA
jgi:hypothetical protein